MPIALSFLLFQLFAFLAIDARAFGTIGCVTGRSAIANDIPNCNSHLPPTIVCIFEREAQNSRGNISVPLCCVSQQTAEHNAMNECYSMNPNSNASNPSIPFHVKVDSRTYGHKTQNRGALCVCILLKFLATKEPKELLPFGTPSTKNFQKK